MRGDYKNRSVVFQHTPEGMNELREVCDNGLCKVGNVFKSSLGTFFVEILMRNNGGNFEPSIVVQEGNTVTRNETEGFGSYLTVSTKSLYAEEDEA